MSKKKFRSSANFPGWFDGTNLSEPLFCTAFLRNHQLIFSEGSFFTPNGRMQDCTPLKEAIFQGIHSYICSGVPNKIKNIIEVLKITAYVPEFPPAEDCIHLKNGTLFLDGTLDSTARHVVRTRLPVVYNPDAPTPTKWTAFLDELLYPEDIPMFQEFVGYLLLPTNKAQRMMIIKGNGGEGKSQIGTVLKKLFGINAKDGSIGKISENQFSRADLEHIHLLIDDDMRMEALKQTNYVKSLVTAKGKMDLEKKGQQSYQGHMFARLLAFSNGDLQSLYDRSDGFYRRQLILTTKAKSPNRVDDPDLADKLCTEMEGILLWAFEGLQRLVANRFRFSESERSRQNRELLKQDGNNLLMFLESEDYIQFDSACAATSKELMAVYAVWCDDNGFAPLKSRTVSDFLIANAPKYHLEHTNNIHSVDGRRVWGFKGIRLMIDAGVRSRDGLLRVYAKDNPFT